MASEALKAPFPYFGGKRTVVAEVWQRFGDVKQYVEPFCGSAAILLGAPAPASLEVVNDWNGFIANFWRSTKYQPSAVAEAADYPVSHIDQGARHRWLMAQRDRLGDELQDPEWPGDAQVAGWWLWGQCSWIGSGWCDWTGKVPHISDAGRGVQAAGQVPHIGNAGRGVQAAGQVPHIGDAGMGDLLTSGGRAAWSWLHKLADRLERVRIVHGDWHRCLNHHYGKERTGVFLDPPYRAYERLYGGAAAVADGVEGWAREHPELRVAICGHVGDYALPGWEMMRWDRGKHTYGSSATTALEAVWFSPACLPVANDAQIDMFSGGPDAE